MFEYGRYTLSYQPPEGAVEADVSMSISSEADLTQMLRFVESFLQASGFALGERELALERTAPDFGDVAEKWWGDDPEYWRNKYFESFGLDEGNAEL
jgi:hypothetical protein